MPRKPKHTNRYWISWEQLSSDYRPLQDPPQPEAICAWWCSGYTDNAATLCAIVEAVSAKRAKQFITDAWDSTGDEIGQWRFCEERPNDWLPNDRFPITEDWVRVRLGLDA